MAENRYHRCAALIFSIVVAFLSLRSIDSLEGPSYLKFVSNATDFPIEDYYDYIIVGGGTAGCPLAATLSKSYRVLILERGGIPYGNPGVMSQDGFLMTLRDGDTLGSAAQSFTSHEGVPNSRGRVLGGSSAINAGFYSRADHDFYRRSGIHWDLDVVNHSYAWVEKAIVFRPELKTWQSALRDGLLEAGINPYNGYTVEHTLGTKIGGSTFDNSGRRHSAADLLNYAKSSNINVVVHASVERVLFASSPNRSENPYAIGVVFLDAFGHFHHAMVREKGEVLLCSGALGSPQLLLLSGIGPRSYLAAWGIHVTHHSPYVGRFLYDNPRNGISIVPPTPVEHSLIQVVGITDSGTYLEGASNMVPFAVPSRSIFIRPVESSVYFTVATIMQKIIGPYSAGSLRLTSTDVRVNPRVRFNYFSHPHDLERCVNGTRRIADVLKTPAMKDFMFDQLFGGRNFRYVGPAPPPDGASDEQVGEFCRRTVSTIWHYHGGCLVGKVVDNNLKVHGINGLRVIDGSILSVSPGTNPQATLLMLGRYFGLKMMEERVK